MFRASEEQPIFQSSIRKSWVHVKELPCTHLLVPIPICFKWNRIIVKSFESTLSLLYPPLSFSLCEYTSSLGEREREREKRECMRERFEEELCTIETTFKFKFWKISKVHPVSVAHGGQVSLLSLDLQKTNLPAHIFCCQLHCKMALSMLSPQGQGLCLRMRSTSLGWNSLFL